MFLNIQMMKQSYKEKYEALLKEFEQYKLGSIEWSVEDFTSLKVEGFQITEEQAEMALADMIRHHDCNYGITWDTVDEYFSKYAEEVEIGTELWRETDKLKRKTNENN